MNLHTPSRIAWAGLTALILAASTPAVHATDVAVSIGFSQPGVYGRVDIGRYPTPVLVAPQPVVIGRPVYAAEPVYLWVPPGHRKDWRRHCGQYGACGAPVYFVEDGWYRQHVVVEAGDDRRGRGRDDDDHDHDRGHGRGRGRGHGRD